MTALAVIVCVALALAVVGFTIAELLVIVDDRRSHRAYDFISEREAANRNEAARLVDEGEFHEHCDWPGCACWCASKLGTRPHPKDGHHAHWGPNTPSGAGDGYPSPSTRGGVS